MNPTKEIFLTNLLNPPAGNQSALLVQLGLKSSSLKGPETWPVITGCQGQTSVLPTVVEIDHKGGPVQEPPLFSQGEPDRVTTDILTDVFTLTETPTTLELNSHK